MAEFVGSGPSLRAIPFGPGMRDAVELLSSRQRLQIASIATFLQFPPGKLVYREGSNAQFVFIIAKGIVKSFRDLPSGKRRVMAFLFADDMFGLGQSGHYVNSAQTSTPDTLYRMRVTTLTETLRHDADLAFQFLCKVTHELRGSLRHTVIVARRDALGRVTMFLRLLEQNSHLSQDSKIVVPMSRVDAANYLGLSLEAVSRALSRLERSGIIAFEGRRSVRVLDRIRFERIAAAL
jgi:CRP/FNR family transcriptional regulator